MRYVKVDHNNAEQKKIDKEQLESCRNKFSANCSECNIYLYSNLF